MTYLSPSALGELTSVFEFGAFDKGAFASNLNDQNCLWTSARGDGLLPGRRVGFGEQRVGMDLNTGKQMITVQGS